MINIVFICYGNICRSPMAEMIFKDLIYKNSKRYLFTCTSRATSIEEIGNPMYPETIKTLKEHAIPIERHIAKQIKKEDYIKYDYIIIMDQQNKKDLLNLFGNDNENKIHFLTEFTKTFKDIEDPWYTGNFQKVYQEIKEGCTCLFQELIERSKVNDNQI